jgi:myo-inositol-1(or 4)-monophosphatase
MTGERQRFGAELEVARAAAAEAAALLLAREGADEVREKARADLVTAVDEASERAITRRIRESFPDDVVVAEEFAGGVEVTGRSWIIDPIDGTTNYVHGHPYCCVSVGFRDEAGLAVSVLHAPFLGEVFHAVRGGGAFLNDRPIRVSAVASGSAGMFATGFPFKKGKGDPDTYMRLVKEVLMSAHGLRRAGSAALDLAYVACGRHDGYFEIGVASWDIAGGLLLVTEAGGRVGGWPGDRDEPMRTGRVLASNGLVHEWLEDMVGKHDL